MRRSDALWLGAIAALVGVDVWRDTQHDGSTLSSATRRIFRVETPSGRGAFCLAWTCFTVWYTAHIVNGTRSGRPAKHH